MAYQAIFRKEVQYSQNGKKLFNIKKSCSIVFLKNNFRHQKLTLILVFPKLHFPQILEQAVRERGADGGGTLLV